MNGASCSKAVEPEGRPAGELAQATLCDQPLKQAARRAIRAEAGQCREAGRRDGVVVEESRDGSIDAAGARASRRRGQPGGTACDVPSQSVRRDRRTRTGEIADRIPAGLARTDPSAVLVARENRMSDRGREQRYRKGQPSRSARTASAAIQACTSPSRVVPPSAATIPATAAAAVIGLSWPGPSGQDPDPARPSSAPSRSSASPSSRVGQRARSRTIRCRRPAGPGSTSPCTDPARWCASRSAAASSRKRRCVAAAAAAANACRMRQAPSQGASARIT